MDMRGGAEPCARIDDQGQIGRAHDLRRVIHRLGQGDERLSLGEAQAHGVAAEIDRLESCPLDEARGERIARAGRCNHPALRHHCPETRGCRARHHAAVLRAPGTTDKSNRVRNSFAPAGVVGSGSSFTIRSSLTAPST